MNGRVAKHLRRIALELKLEPQTAYAPGGKLRRYAPRLQKDAEGHMQWVQGPPIPRPTAMRECFRRAYKEAKKLFKGLPPSMCVPEEKAAEETPFRVKVAKSIRDYHNVA